MGSTTDLCCRLSCLLTFCHCPISSASDLPCPPMCCTTTLARAYKTSGLSFLFNLVDHILAEWQHALYVTHKVTCVRLPVCQLKGPWHWRYQQPPLLPHPVQADLHHHHDALQEPT